MSIEKDQSGVFGKTDRTDYVFGTNVALTLTSTIETATLTTVITQQYVNDQWAEPDFDQVNVLIEPPNWTEDMVIIFTGDGSAIPTKGVFRFKLQTVSYPDGASMGETFTQPINVI